ncbi:MAG TPA: adenylate/guanylate cyclase domain-containing protein [Thermodesulfobacteriota bacterium]|nr:adenylate/guanylate cyclase domain-containing protein [Thermodesulfobacteriota bacterium]
MDRVKGVKLFNHNIWKVIVLTLSSFAISLMIYLSGVLDVFELKAYDLYSRRLNPETTSENIIIIRIDQRSIDVLSKEGITWPWPRQMYAPIIKYLSEADAVFIDILFTEQSSYGKEDDLIFAGSIKKASNVYLPVFLSRESETLSPKDEEFLSRIEIKGEISPALKFKSAVIPVKALREAIRGSGNVTISPDEDGVYRKIPLVFQLQRHIIPHFILGYLIEKGIVKAENKHLYLRDHTKIPLQDGKLMLRYTRGKKPFRVFSASEILKAYLDSNSSLTPDIRKGFFKGKVVFIGLTAAGLYDLRPTSVSSISTGVFIHATTFENIVNENFIRPVSVIFLILFSLLICVIISYSVLKSYSLFTSLPVFLLTLIIIISVTAVLFKVTIYMGVIPLVTSLVVSFIISVAYSYATEGKQRLLIKNTLLQYMDKKVANYLLENPSLIKPGGKMKRVTVFFADIAGFTSISEITPAEEIAKMLHTVLNSFTEVIINNNGVIDKYIGDCVMSFWGAPLDTDKDELNACRAAAQCLDSISQINNKFRQENIPQVDIRIGIHSGYAVAGNLGSDRIFHYTVIGDTVNLASRLESVNKFFKTRVIVSEDTFKETGDVFIARELGLIAVKGKTLPIKIFEILGEKEGNGASSGRLVELFAQGIALYKEQRLHEAIQVFDKILEEYPYDGPSEFYRKRCQHLMSYPYLTEDWNVIKFTEK